MGCDNRERVKAYRERGFAVCKIQPGQKNPTYRNWTRFSLEAEDFTESDSVGIMAGRLSGDLVCIDIDDAEALAQADHYLPATGMEEGRPGKPRSHRWYRVVDIPPAWTAECAGGIGGPRTAQFARRRGDMVVEFRGTGSQSVVPPSLWTSRDGMRQERRVWHAFGEPTVLGCLELLEAVAAFARAFGAKNKRWEGQSRLRSQRQPKPKEVEAPVLLPLPRGETARKARSYLKKVEPAVEGQGGDRHTFWVACLLVRDFALSVEEALPLMLEWNQTCRPPWSEGALRHKLERALALEGKRGGKLRAPSRKVEVHIRPGEQEVLVGVDCAVEGQSYVNLAPDLWAGLVRHDHTFALVRALYAIDWAGKVVTLATPSNVMTNKKVVLDEFRLAHLLRERGAEVRSLRIASSDGRRLTFSKAEEVEVTTPPRTPREAQEAAQKASQRARERGPAWRTNSRTKPSVKMVEAAAWLKKKGITQVTKDVVRKAKRKRLSERTLYRAIEQVLQDKIAS